jgi:cell division protein ZapA (FtsZ GTPase activity inhibitor)
MSNRETVELTIAGHQLKLTATDEERPHVDRASRRVSEMIQKLQASGGATSPARVATMVAFQCAYELSVADEMLEEAQQLHEELQRQKEAVKRLESLLSRVDDALAY